MNAELVSEGKEGEGETCAESESPVGSVTEEQLKAQRSANVKARYQRRSIETQYKFCFVHFISYSAALSSKTKGRRVGECPLCFKERSPRKARNGRVLKDG